MFSKYEKSFKKKISKRLKLASAIFDIANKRFPSHDVTHKLNSEFKKKLLRPLM